LRPTLDVRFNIIVDTEYLLDDDHAAAPAAYGIGMQGVKFEPVVRVAGDLDELTHYRLITTD